jgi:CelD/BcsL family acetyltransferase involved in cellulose biosynthesis
MLTLERVPYDSKWWDCTLNQFADRNVYQTSAWLAFLEETQKGEVVIAALREGNSVLGYFSGLVVQTLGVRLLGSPLPGWSTSYMGFNLHSSLPRSAALEALRRFAFHDLQCAHMEVMDRRFGQPETRVPRFRCHEYKGFEIDLRQSEEELFAGVSSSCRTCIRKAAKSGVSLEQVDMDDEAFVEEYCAQMQDVFAKQKLVPTYDAERVRAVIRHLGPTGHLLLLRARDAEGRSIATGIYPAMHTRAYIWGGASLRDFQILRPNEALTWRLMTVLKKRGIQFFDLGGGGEYKQKYGGARISVPWLRSSRYPFLETLRQCAATLTRARQRWNGVLNPAG